ncbi:LOW QUALITY PROTEIN: Rhoptry kinase family protein ROP25, putative [Eimeria mitis]|uniref:Rhoptry kinase family protein ROP25, putative n=1 Tax=Eimeria mitis TaxID=44415 RepID=U6K375_9EIME|nr:LOW QUALITY PROTEIN: Rhoptry kinase family protein ROP25, putative [Eimeria mitis]CDJ31411.1 Rhoptry kinase family protein ROP25, putative [Eimeria mitis]
MIGELRPVEGQDSMVSSPPSIDKHDKADVQMQDVIDSSTVSTRTGSRTTRWHWERYFVYFLTLGVATALLFTIFPRVPEAVYGRLPVSKESRDYRGGSHSTQPSVLPPSSAVEPQQQKQGEGGQAPSAGGEEDTTKATGTESSLEDQIPLYDAWGLPMLDEFLNLVLKTRFPSMTRGDCRCLMSLRKRSLQKQDEEKRKLQHFLQRIAYARIYQLMERLYGAVIDLYVEAGSVVKKAREYMARRLLQIVLKIQQAGLSHNDLKWDNMLLRSDGSFVISDLGSALSFGSPCRKLTLFTPQYREPQLALRPDPEAYDGGFTIPHASSDLWSLGILLYELFTGETYPYGEMNVKGVEDPDMALAAWLIDNGIRSSTLKPSLDAANIPTRWQELIMRLLEPNRRHRITSWEIMEEFPDLVRNPE